jgi:hypothetical protein
MEDGWKSNKGRRDRCKNLCTSNVLRVEHSSEEEKNKAAQASEWTHTRRKMVLDTSVPSIKEPCPLVRFAEANTGCADSPEKHGQQLYPAEDFGAARLAVCKSAVVTHLGENVDACRRGQGSLRLSE